MIASTARRPVPDLRHERELLRAGARLVAGMDEVGRGSLAGPVSVGVVVVDLRTAACPAGLADSKLLSARARTQLLPALGRWGRARAVGHASAAEIDAEGIIAALRRAGRRALAAVTARVGAVDAVLLDGSYDWLSPRPADLFAGWEQAPVQREVAPGAADDAVDGPVVHLRVKADQSCASVAAASVLAKCERDALMVRLARNHPEYRWDANKGYASPEHLAALAAHGPSPWHRTSWRLPPSTAAATVEGG